MCLRVIIFWMSLSMLDDACSNVRRWHILGQTPLQMHRASSGQMRRMCTKLLPWAEAQADVVARHSNGQISSWISLKSTIRATPPELMVAYSLPGGPLMYSSICLDKAASAWSHAWSEPRRISSWTLWSKQWLDRKRLDEYKPYRLHQCTLVPLCCWEACNHKIVKWYLAKKLANSWIPNMWK